MPSQQQKGMQPQVEAEEEQEVTKGHSAERIQQHKHKRRHQSLLYMQHGKIYLNPKEPVSLVGLQALYKRAHNLHVPGVMRVAVAKFL